MIYMIRSTRMEGDWDQSVQWAVKVAQYINEKFPEMHVQVLRNVNGSLGQIHWSSRYASLAVCEEIMAKVEADPGYQALMEESQELFDPNFTQDHYYRTVD